MHTLVTQNMGTKHWFLAACAFVPSLFVDCPGLSSQDHVFEGESAPSKVTKLHTNSQAKVVFLSILGRAITQATIGSPFPIT